MEQNPWISIWTQPRATILRIIAENPNRSFWPLAAIYGFCSLMNLFQSMVLGEAMGTFGILFLAFILSPFWGYVNFTVWSWFVTFVGKWFKGQGNFTQVRSAYAWSCVPTAINIPLWLLMVALFGHQLFLNFPQANFLPNAQVFFLFSILILKMVLAIWSLVIYLNALAAVQQFSILRAILNIFVAGLILGVLFFLIWNGLVYVLSGTLPATFIIFNTL